MRMVLAHSSLTPSDEPAISEGAASQQTVQAEPTPEAASAGQPSLAA